MFHLAITHVRLVESFLFFLFFLWLSRAVKRIDGNSLDVWGVGGMCFGEIEGVK